jgi:hypothetical protein
VSVFDNAKINTRFEICNTCLKITIKKKCVVDVVAIVTRLRFGLPGTPVDVNQQVLSFPFISFKASFFYAAALPGHTMHSPGFRCLVYSILEQAIGRSFYSKSDVAA